MWAVIVIIIIGWTLDNECSNEGIMERAPHPGYSPNVLYIYCIEMIRIDFRQI